MIRLPLLLSTVFMAATAFAEPRVGERATYTVTTTRNGKSVSSTNVSEFVRFDRATHRFLQRDICRVPGRPDRVEDTWKGAAELLTDEKIQSILDDCTSAGGVSTLRWVPAGIYRACILPVKADDDQPYDGRIWIAHVPFGIIHAEMGRGAAQIKYDLYEFEEP